jgi:hypothetical protein
VPASPQAMVWLLALAQSAGGAPPPSPSQPPAAPALADPARLTFPAGTSGLVLVLVKADRAADYEAVLTAIKAEAGKADDATRQTLAGWQVLKAREADAKGNLVYVHWLASPAADVDYRPSMVLDRLAATLPEPLLAKYRDAIAGGPNRLTLDRVTDLGLVLVTPPKR